MPRIFLLMFLALAVSPALVADDGDWLKDAQDDETRYERLSQYLGGFSSAMLEVGYRYEKVMAAIGDENHELASYHWGKIRDAIEGGYMKRPGRKENSRRMFLDGPWGTLDEALKSGETDDIHTAFQAARGACMACHVAEDVEFMNDQAMFRQSGD